MDTMKSIQVHIPEQTLNAIRQMAKKNQIRGLVLFGSRARGEELPRSDIDLAVYGCREFSEFQYQMNEELPTLLRFDLINMDEEVSEKLKEEINRDGVLIYGKV
ncbi:MAG: nucleotidyltransferase family protein [Bilifractor sp.]